MYEENIGNGNPIGLTNASAKFCMSANFFHNHDVLT